MESGLISEGTIIDRSRSMYGSILRGYSGQYEVAYPHVANHYFGVVVAGDVEIQAESKTWHLSSDMYFSLPGPLKLKGNGKLSVVERMGYRGLPMCGGPFEESGRLVYIDNCHTSLLVPPPRVGDPVFNLLVFPPNVEQTRHIHPSIRMGTIIRGSGSAVLDGGKKVALEPGKIFCLDEREIHCFHSGPEGMALAVYHPDSDVGPSDQTHPMLSRTYRIS